MFTCSQTLTRNLPKHICTPYTTSNRRKWLFLYPLLFLLPTISITTTWYPSRSCLTLCNSMACSLPGSSVHGIFQARLLGQVAISYSRGSSWPRDWTCVSCIGRQILYHWATLGSPPPPWLPVSLSIWSTFTFLCYMRSEEKLFLKVQLKYYFQIVNLLVVQNRSWLLEISCASNI